MNRKTIVLIFSLTLLLSMFAFSIPRLSNVEATNFPDENPVDWWPMFQHDPGHTGYTDMEVLPPLAVKWIFDASEGLFNLVVVEGSAYASSNSKLYAINATDGSLRWTCNDVAGGYPAVVNNVIYIGGWWDKFDALDARNGSVIWEYSTGAPNMGAPVIVENIVYFSSDNGYAYALTADRGSLLWKYETGFTRNSPTVANGIVYLAGWNSSTTIYTLYAINATDGNPIWNYTSTLAPGGSGLTSASVSDGIVYLGEGFDYGPPPAPSNVLAINASTGKVIWVSQIADTSLWRPPTIDKGKLYVSSWVFDRKIYAFNASSGALQWTFQTQNASSASGIAISGNIVYFGETFSYSPNSAKLYALNATDGSLLWTFDFAGSGIYGLAIADNTVYFSTDYGTLYAFKPVATRDITITNITCPKTVVCQGYRASINVTVINQDIYAMTLNVTLYANTLAIASRTITLTSGNSTIIDFKWNTTDWAKVSYRISAVTDRVEGETSTTNSFTFVDGRVYVSSPGNVFPDWKVDMRDISLVASAFDSYPGHPRWIPNADINDDGRIDMKDIAIAAKNFGKTGF